MRNILVAFLLGFTTLVASAVEPFEIEKPVLCSDLKTVIESMSGPDWAEMPFWVGKDARSRYVLLVNQKTKTWTIVQYNDQIACVLGTGVGHTVVLTGPKV